jgi:hypothetical protein
VLGLRPLWGSRLTAKGRGGGVAYRKLDESLTVARAVVRQSGDSAGQWRRKAYDGGVLRCEGEGNEDSVGEER